ncbi:MAG: ribosome small subunit-dependent GTPase A [Spirochaetales bacterium]|nr:ribosome small subunit-dependent GTPase A [Spirochaetales bacterium]
MLKGIVVSGINNIYNVKANDRTWVCRIKGKVFQSARKFHNPIAAGDMVQFVPYNSKRYEGWIVSREDRTTSLVRWNKKRKAPQVLAANAQLQVCITSTDSPPFRPRFLDRLILMGEIGEMQAVIILNKIDLGITEFVRNRIDNFKDIGYNVLFCSAETGEGMESVKEYLKGKVSVLTGQSGVGKSSILNRLGGKELAFVGLVSKKYNRGSHTTNSSNMYFVEDGNRRGMETVIIDTPGMRELEIYGIEPDDLSFYFIDINKYSGMCQYPSCRHINEPGCAVRKAVSQGEIHSDRYQSYISIYNQLYKSSREMYGRA